MNWLIWSPLDLINGPGGVETHCRCLARELRKLKIDVEFSQNPREIDNKKWDVIHTHGSSIFFKSHFLGRNGPPSRIWVHTLHGLTHERMLACKEWAWPGGYRAIAREILGLTRADVILSVHPDLSLYKIFQKTKRTTQVCFNGWDSWNEDENESRLETSMVAGEGKFWLYVGRGEDKVKGTKFLEKALRLNPEIRLLATPGEGFGTDNPRIVKTGSKNPNEVRELMSHAAGIVLPSVYEGLPLVVLEALAMGLPVICNYVGGLKTLSPELTGLNFVDCRNPNLLVSKMTEIQNAVDISSRINWSNSNKKILKTWKDVATISLRSVEAVFEQR